MPDRPPAGRSKKERLDEALNATRDRPDGFLKALVVNA